MARFQTADSYPPEKTPATPSPERARLAELQRIRRDALAAADVERAKISRLETIIAAVEPARAALAEYDAHRAVALSNWAAGAVTGLPKTDAARRAELAAELENAELAAGAAKIAIENCRCAAEIAEAPAVEAGRQLLDIAKVEMLSEARKLFQQVAEAIAAAEAIHRQIDAAHEAALDGIPYGGGEGHSEVLSALEVFRNERREAEAMPVAPAKDFQGEWRKLIQGLTLDATISFDDAQSLDVPFAPSVPSAIDPVVAAANAAASFPTRDAGWN